jgi:hypothetical protein
MKSGNEGGQAIGPPLPIHPAGLLRLRTLFIHLAHHDKNDIQRLQACIRDIVATEVHLMFQNTGRKSFVYLSCFQGSQVEIN